MNIEQAKTKYKISIQSLIEKEFVVILEEIEQSINVGKKDVCRKFLYKKNIEKLEGLGYKIKEIKGFNIGTYAYEISGWDN